MSLIIEDPELDQKIHSVANALGKSIEETLRLAIDAIEVPARPQEREIGNEISWPAVRCLLAEIDASPVLDHRTPDEIIGYNEHGHFD